MRELYARIADQPGVWEGLKKRSFTAINAGCGIGQWTNTGGDTHGRLYKMSRYCAQHGGVYNGDAQCGYILEENVWLNNDTSYGYHSLSDFLASTSTDLAALTHAWNINWEGIHDGSWDARVEYARLCLNYLTNHAGDQITWTSVNNWITQSEQLNNCVAVYQYFNSDGSGINPDPVKPVDDGMHRVTIIGTGGGSAGASPELAKEGTEISYRTSADSTEYTFDRWIVQWPPSLSLSGSSGTFTMPGTDVVARAQYSGGASGPYSDTTILYVIVTGYVKAEIMVETQDGGRATHTITFDSNHQNVYTYDIGISDPVHIKVNAGTTVSPVTRYVPGWTDDSENRRYFYFQPNIGVTLIMIGQPATDTLRKRKYKWWQYMRPVWTW